MSCYGLKALPNDSNTNSNAFKSSFLAFFLCPWSFAVLVARKRSRLFNRLPRPDALDCDKFSIDLALCNAENTRFPLELEVSGRYVSELAVCSSKIFLTSSEASPRQDDCFERDKLSICADNCSVLSKTTAYDGQREIYVDWGRVSSSQPLCSKSLNENKSR